MNTEEAATLEWLRRSSNLTEGVEAKSFAKAADVMDRALTRIDTALAEPFWEDMERVLRGEPVPVRKANWQMLEGVCKKCGEPVFLTLDNPVGQFNGWRHKNDGPWDHEVLWPLPGARGVNLRAVVPDSDTSAHVPTPIALDMFCPSGCGCKPGQADMRDCACDGPCVFDEAWRATDV